MTLAERNDQIVERRAQGATFKDIGSEFGITPTRVQQIVERDLRRARVRAAQPPEPVEVPTHPCFICRAPVPTSARPRLCGVCLEWAHDQGSVPGYGTRWLRVLSSHFENVEDALASTDQFLMHVTQNFGVTGVAWLRNVTDWPKSRTPCPTCHGAGWV